VLHPDFWWTSHLGEVFDREQYIAANTTGPLTWKAQSLAAPDIVVVGETAVLRCLVTDQVDAGQGAQSFHMPMTQTWIRTSAGWQCLAGHTGPRLNI
jgi:hypothetical protein